LTDSILYCRFYWVW